MSFQCFFRNLGKIAQNLGFDVCAPKDFLTAKCLIKSLVEDTACISGQSLVDTDGVTLVNNTTYTYTATTRGTYLFTAVTSAEGDQSIFINGVDTTVDLAAATVVGFLLCPDDVLTVVDPAAGAGAAWVRVFVPLPFGIA